jgi:hypothetical protein
MKCISTSIAASLIFDSRVDRGTEMSPERRLLLVEHEMERFIGDEREQPQRDRVHIDRMSRILTLDTAGVF